MNIKQVAYSFFTLIAFAVMPLVSFATGSFVSGPNAVAGFVDANYGSVNLSPTNGGVTITQTHATGYAWGDYIGWVNFDPSNGGVDVQCSSGTATLSGYAWSQNAGWVNFGPFSGGNTTDQVTIDSSGNMDGYAWVQNAGWLDFRGKATTFSCSTSCTGSSCNSGPTGPTCSISVSPQQITTPGLPVTLSWAVTGSSSLSFTIPSLNVSSSVNGSVVVNPTQTTAYSGIVMDGNSGNTCNQTVIVSTRPSVLACTWQNALNYNADKFDKNVYDIIDNGRCVFDPDEKYELEYTDEVLNNDSCSYFDTYLKKGARGIEVAKVQNFLNKYMNANVKVDGVFGQTTVDAVKRFQSLHSQEIIDPWKPFLTKPSGWWYKTTAGTANIIVGCTQTPVFLETPQKEFSFDGAVKNLFNKLLNLVNNPNGGSAQ